MGALLTKSGHKRAQNLKHRDNLTSSPLVALGNSDTGNSWGGGGPLPPHGHLALWAIMKTHRDGACEVRVDQCLVREGKKKGKKSLFSSLSIQSLEVIPSHPHPLGKPAGLLQASLNFRAVSVTRRVEEVNWAAWEKTLPTLSEDPSGAGITGEWPWG